MLYLLDANVLIDANRDYYPTNRVPEFWDWLEHHGTNGSVKVPREIFDEVNAGSREDGLTRWINRDPVKAAILLSDEADPAVVGKVVADGYAKDLNDEEVQKVGNDPFLIAYALDLPGRTCVVTTETSKPSWQRANRKIPDVCKQLGVGCCTTFELVQRLDFWTGWRSSTS